MRVDTSRFGGQQGRYGQQRALNPFFCTRRDQNKKEGGSSCPYCPQMPVLVRERCGNRVGCVTCVTPSVLRAIRRRLALTACASPEPSALFRRGHPELRRITSRQSNPNARVEHRESNGVFDVERTASRIEAGGRRHATRVRSSAFFHGLDWAGWTLGGPMDRDRRLELFRQIYSALRDEERDHECVLVGLLANDEGLDLHCPSITAGAQKRDETPERGRRGEM